MNPPTKKCVLQIKDGKFVTVRMESEVPTLCAMDGQDEPVVDIWEKTEGDEMKNMMALGFKLDDHYYFLKVTKAGDLQLEQAEKPNTTANDHWFQKNNVGGGDHCFLQSALNNNYLFIQEDHRKIHFILSHYKAVLVSFTDSA